MCALTVCPISAQDVEDMCQVLADVEDWQGLAGWLNVETITIEERCASSNSPAMCCRRELVRRYCNRLLSQPRKIAEDVAQVLERMDHKRQAEELRQLKFGKSVANRSSPLNRRGKPHIA